MVASTAAMNMASMQAASTSGRLAAGNVWDIRVYCLADGF